MKTKLFILLLIIFANVTQAAIDWDINGGNEIIESADIFGTVTITNNAVVDMTGGEVDLIRAFGALDLNISGGHVALVYVNGTSAVTFSGGDIDSITVGLNVSDDASITFVCDLDSLNYFYDQGLLVGVTGSWLDSSSFDIEIQNLGYNPTSDYINFGPEPATLVAHWAFDETSGDIAYDSAGNNDGTLIGGPAWTSGQIDGALSFDGYDDYVSADSVTSLIAGRNVTMSCWVKSPSVNPAVQFIVSLNTYDGDNRILMGTQAGSNTLSVAGMAWHDTGVTVIDGGWHHVAYVLNNAVDTFVVYIDGSNVLSLPSIVSVAADDLLSFGQDFDSGLTTGDFYQGLMDDVRIYNQALSGTDIQQLYDEGMGFFNVSPSEGFVSSGDVGGPFTPGSKDYLLTNFGDTAIDWDVQYSSSWLDISSTSGTLAPGESTAVTVTLNSNADMLGWGEYADAVMFRNITDPLTIKATSRQISLDVNGPIVGLSTNTFDFTVAQGGSSPADQTLTVSNIGIGILNWAITGSDSWLSFDPASGSSAGEGNEIKLSVDITGLSAGGHNCVLTVSDPLSENGLQTVIVNLTIATTLYVPAQFPTIQSAINAALIGDTIIVAPGTYYENLRIRGKNITLTSTDPDDPIVVGNTIIDGTRSGSVITFGGTETNNCILTGFTITNGNAKMSNYSGGGGGINGRGSFATISNCIITGNSASGHYVSGGGLRDCDGSIINCVISNNKVTKGGGGGLVHCDGLITNCIISNNNAQRGGGGLSSCKGLIANNIITGNYAYTEGGGLVACNGTIVNCLVNGNTGRHGGGMEDCSGSIVNCVIDGNLARYDGGGLRDCNGLITNCVFGENIAVRTNNQLHTSSIPTYSCIKDWTANGEGNINDNPLFVASGYRDDNGTVDDYEDDLWFEGDYHLQADSPCIDLGNNTIGTSSYDLDGNPRIINAVVDMGAYEFVPPSIKSGVKFTPQTLNCSSEGNWVKAYFTLPEEYSTEDVDTDRQVTIYSPGVASDHINVLYNTVGLVEVEAVFVRSELCGLGLYGDFEFTARGWFADGMGFFGADTIRITTNRFEKLADFLSYWLDTDCSEPGWCGGYDIDGDGAVDLKDFVLLE